MVSRNDPKAWCPSRWIGERAIRFWLLLAAPGVLLFLCGMANHGLKDAQEPYVGGIIREMVDSRDWVVPTLNGQPYLEKPPLYYICGSLFALCFHSFAPWVLRLPSALFSLATVLWIAWLGRRRGSSTAGWWAGLMVGTSDLFFRTGHTAVVDMSLVFTVSLGLGFVWLLNEEPENQARWSNCVWLGMGLAFLAKGPLGPLLIGLPLVAQLFLFRDLPLLRRLFKPRWGMALCVSMAGSWILLLWLRGGWSYFEDAMIRNSIGRFLQSPGLVPMTGALGQHRENPFIYILHSPFNLMPWLFLAAGSLFAKWPLARWREDGAARLFIPLVLIVDVGFLSVSSMRRAVYVLPVIPLVFLHVGLWTARRIRDSEGGACKADRPLKGLLAVTAGFVFVAAIVAPWVIATSNHLSWALPALYTIAALGLGLRVLASLRLRDLRAVLDWTFALWMIVLTLLIFVLPPLRDVEDRFVGEPFWTARYWMQEAGVDVRECGLAEAELGYASLILRRRLPSLKDYTEVRRALAEERPVAVLLASAVPLDASAFGHQVYVVPHNPRLPAKLQSRTPYLVLNERAMHAPVRPPVDRLLPPTSFAGTGSWPSLAPSGPGIRQ